MNEPASSFRKRGAKPGGNGEPVLVRLQPDLLDALDRFIRTHGAAPTRPEALRLAFRQWATERGLLNASQDGIRPQDLNATNDD